MNNVFLCLFNKGKNLAKYFIFSLVFVLTCFVGIDTVKAVDDNLLTGREYTPNISISGITSIDGTLIDACISPANNEYLAYTIIGASHNATTTGGYSNCVSYRKDSTHQYFYLQATDIKDTEGNRTTPNRIKFSVTGLDRRYNYIAVFEPNYSLTNETGYDYDLYTNNGTSYTGIRKTAVAGKTYWGSATTSDSSTYTFEYELRNDVYGEHTVNVYFYTAEPEANNETLKTTIAYTLAKPIDEYVFTSGKDTATCTTDTDTTKYICVDYTSNPNSGSEVTGTVTNDFAITFNKNAALYFSTLNTHSTLDGEGVTVEIEKTIANIKKYNSVYATNTFSNEGLSDSIIFYYYNLKDNSEYTHGVSANDSGYSFTLTIDASGAYRFFLEDIFGNELVNETFKVEVDDVSNRELTIFFIAYKTDGSVLNSGTSIDSFQLKEEELSKITNENVKIGLEFYYKVQISGDYGIKLEGTSNILNNPLYETMIRMRDNDSSTGEQKTYYCRQEAYNSETCVVPGKGSNFTKQVLRSAEEQHIAATNTGLKEITNGFVYQEGMLYGVQSDISSVKKSNRVDFLVNENGVFFVRLQDKYGNHKTGTIQVSIVDQLKPVITLNGSTTGLNNYLCSSMYVIGTGGTIQTYPTGVLSDTSCGSGNSVSYDHFVEVDTSNGTEKKDTISVKVTRPSGEYKTNTNGFYNPDTNSVSFNYADAIRMGLLRISDSITVYNADAFEKSKYEKINETYTEYGLYSLTTTASTFTGTILGASYSSGRINYGNTKIITDNYIQYSSELNAYDASGNQFIVFKVFAYDSGNNQSDLVCDSELNETKCYNIVNVYIDKAISFDLVFTAKDFAGNVSNEITLNIDVIDDTTPGITTIDDTTGEILTDPIIAANNIDTECRLEIGSVIQTKAQLLECYGITETTSGNVKYNFVDNTTEYAFIDTNTYAASNYYKNILLEQLYTNTTYDSYVKVYVCKTSRTTTAVCDGTSGKEWIEVTADTTIKFENAGNYEIKFVITDVNGDYKLSSGNGALTNTTTLIMNYYVNPRVLLVRPLETEKVYGDDNPTIQYCVYATKNTNAFYSNLFNVSDTYKFILDNYESAAFGMVYCTSGNTVDDTNAAKVSKTDILVNESADIEGALSRTYATGANRLKMELTTANNDGHAVYEDAGYYYITLGDLKIKDAHKQNYILRLHPSYLLDGEIPNPGLKNYYEVASEVKDGETVVYENDYKYGVNTNYKGENVSNVLYTIKQTVLTVTANGGSKIYGNTDTNYKQAFNKSAESNISSLTYKTATGTNTETISTSGYLNGYTVNGLIHNNLVTDFTRYSSIIEGYLRREIGEIVGRYYICNIDVSVTGTDNTIAKDTECDYLNIEINTTSTSASTIVSLTTSNVFKSSYDVANKKTVYTAITSADEIKYGNYVEIDGNYFKLTRDNTNLGNKQFTNFSNAKLWQYNYDDSTAAVKILVNTMNGNQNYYLEYNDAIYTIELGEVIVQPGYNQGKEYSDPEHNDPIFEIIVYGEKLSITSSETANTSFNGYTVSVAQLAQPTTPTQTDYSGKSGYENDTELYFTDRRTKTHDVANDKTFEYKFDAVNLVSNKFTVDGVVYVYDSSTNKFYVETDSSESYDNGATIGVKTITISDNKVTVTLSGMLTYQNYVLFTSDGTAGTGYITRQTGKAVGWYEYIFDRSKLHVVSNGNTYCSVNSDNIYSISPTGNEGLTNCANYNVVYTDNAPYKVNADNKIVTTTTGQGYLHNGDKYCSNIDTYSVSCGGSETDQTNTKIKFLIFKRDIILSFNAASNTYGEVYSYYRDGVFAIEDKKSSEKFPTVITCYKKDSAGVYVASNGNKYSPISNADCATADFGLSANDTWGANGLNLQFFLHNSLSEKFTESYYPLPSGLYYVYASIGSSSSGSGTAGTYIHSNYKLVYINYDQLVAGKNDKTQEDGALKIKPKDVTLTGTNYQKEFGQAKYATYNSNGSTLDTTTDETTKVISSKLANATAINIFDNHYYYCLKGDEETYNADKENKIYYGCTMDSNANKNTHTNYYYGATSNVYLYTVSGMVDETGKGSYSDEIDVNFVGTPVRARPTNQTTGDAYGLLDDVGYYTIDLSGIQAVVAQYTGFTFSIDKGTIKRDTNYNITGYTNGLLYITPAQIEIEVTDGQTKMYGCAYNSVNTTSNNSSYKYGEGYTNCIETTGQYYDLGYEYTVSGDKAQFLKSNTTQYSTFNACDVLADRKSANSCSDIAYSDIEYTVSPNYTNNVNGDGKAANTSLNSGNLFRIPKDSGEAKTTYGYLDLYKLSLASQKVPSEATYQNQTVGDYVITLGSLDALFNSNKHCNASSMPASGATGVYSCKNFIVNYGNNNTSNHVSKKSESDGAFSDVSETNTTEFSISNTEFLFTITTRKVVMTTEYNYKVIDDTEPNEGYTCQNLIDMFTYAGSNFSTSVSLTGRTYCTSANTFIKTGVSRYYAIDNSLAKAPWTGWTTSSNNTYTTYNDILFDVIDSSSQIIRLGLNDTASASQDDPVGKYRYEYQLTLASSFNGDNYEINYLSSNTSEATPTATKPTTKNDTVGFAKIRGTSELDRWYDDKNHMCVGNAGTTTIGDCSTYSGTQAYNFAINGIKYYNTDTNSDYKKANSYYTTVTNATTETLISTMQPSVYFEIVRREIFIQTLPVEKDYGFEDKYTQFEVKLCSEYEATTNTCTEVTKTTTWGQRNSLSNEDYNKFYPSGVFNQAAFKGSNNDYTYRGFTKESDGYKRAFGIYFYRTYGEVTGEYVIVACATQFENDTECRDYYAGLSAESGKTLEETRLSKVNSFISEGTSTDYNASGYIVKTIPSKITINQRKIYITPDSDQGFDYGNFETGFMVSPITFTENYVETGTTKTSQSGLVNGKIYNSDDAIKNQISLCIYDISGRLTCINDRQNSSGGTVTKYITTGLHNSGTSIELSTSARPTNICSFDTASTISCTTYINFNVYNDSYDKDNDDTRFALNRALSSDENARYNRNVGTYTITAGEMFSSVEGWDPYCSTTKTSDCLNVNYKIVGFESGITYTISPATIIITPDSNQSKIYGKNDVELTFTINTYFEFKDVNTDDYYCAGSNPCQKDANTLTFKNYISKDDDVIKLTGFAYSEDDKLAGYDGTTQYNYGKSKVSNKSNSYKEVASDYGSDGDNNPKFYDKYCYRSGATDGVFSDCVSYNAPSHAYASMKYGNTSRILLGYLYVEDWNQKVGTHNIMNGISVAKNEFGLVNYLYKANLNDADDVLVAIGDDKNIDFTINQLAVTATIEDITKVYGQATDSHKCDDASAHVNDGCNKDYATLTADDNEGRLEYNFNVTGNGVNTIDTSKVILTKAVNSQYYTQTGNPEYKNIHLGLTVVRKINNSTTCILDTDKYGCEDVGEYELIFRKQEVPDNVDSNYNLSYGSAASVSLINNTTGYAIVVSTTKEINETNGYINDTNNSYIVYKSEGLDTIPSGQNSGNSDGSSAITVINGHSAKLTINKRNVVFYIGTYNADGSPAERFVIEENEQVPELPAINNKFTTTTTDPYTKQVYYNTWFDEIQYNSSNPVNVTDVTHTPRQVRTDDTLETVYDVVNSSLAYGVGICNTYTNDIQGAKYGSSGCSELIKYSDANKIVNNKYIFDTTIPLNADGTPVADTISYAIVRDPSQTYIRSEANETKNYNTDDYNGVLVIYQDQTAPIIQIGNDKFALEANADIVNDTGCVVNESGKTFKYTCSISGLLFDENNKSLGNIIEYITNNYSDYNNTNTTRNKNATIHRMPSTLNNLNDISVYFPVNNIGVTSLHHNTTLYSVDRYLNTYDFDTDYIDSELEAISSIISWFNINSYDYSYIRENNYQTKRYTPRYYFFIDADVDSNLTTFDPTYVGDFTITIYAVDDVGNQATSTVTLQIIDTTKPITSEMHIFNAPVECSDDNCKTNTIDSWTVKAGYVPINAFIKYRYDTDTASYIEDNTNGIYIKLNGTYVNIYGTTIARYLAVNDTTTNILGDYVKVTEGNTKAVEVEHKYWTNITEKYLVIVGGKDNSYIDATKDDAKSQWNTYYTIDNGSSWYRYQRHNNEGVMISVKDGVNAIFTKILDTGRSVTVSTSENGYVYYNNMYLRYVASGSVCSNVTGCAEVGGSEKPITQVQNVPLTTTDNVNYKFKIQSIDVNFNTGGIDKIVTWTGQTTSLVASEVETNKYQFRFGIMTCTIDMTVDGNYHVDCETKYKLVYNSSNDDKVSKDKHTYNVLEAASARNMNDWDTITETVTDFYKDRRYFFIDTAAPTLTLNGDGYGVYEYATKCYSGIGSEDDQICKTSYDEKFINASDTISSTNTSSTVTSGVSIAIADYLKTSLINSANYTDIILYTGNEYSKVTDISAYTTSGLLEDNTLVLSGNSVYTNTEDNATFNKNQLSLAVYLTTKKGNEASKFYRYLAIYNGEKYYVIKQEYDASSSQYNVISDFSNSLVVTTNYTTIEAVLEYIVSTESISSDKTSEGDLTFSINYLIKDVAGNTSTPLANTTVRGATYTKLSSTISMVQEGVPVNPTTGVSLVETGDNMYSVSVNQGMSFASVLGAIRVTNINNNGENNLNSIKQSLYYNGRVIFENMNYNEDILSIIDDYATSPGTYTLKLTSTRNVTGLLGTNHTVSDKPLVIDFVVNLTSANTIDNVDNSMFVASIILMSMATLFLLGLGYIAIKKTRK